VEKITGLTSVMLQETVNPADIEAYSGPGSGNRRSEEALANLASARGASLEKIFYIRTACKSSG